MSKKLQILALALMLVTVAAAESTARQVLKQETPEYPALLKKMGIGGTVKLSAMVAPDGTVKKTKINGGNPMLGEIACAAVSKWKFSPAAQSSSVPVEMTFDSKSASVSVK
jgi:TonB family protein